MGGGTLTRADNVGLARKVGATHFLHPLDSARSGLEIRSSLMEMTGNSNARMHASAIPLVRWRCSAANDGARAQYRTKSAAASTSHARLNTSSKLASLLK